MNKLCSEAHVFHDDVVQIFSSDAPCFLSRIGGSDTNAVIDYLGIRERGADALDLHVKHYLPAVEQWNGFYDLTDQRVENYIRYLNTLLDNYVNARVTTFGHSHFLSIYFPNQIHQRFIKDDIPNRAVLEDFVNRIIEQDDFVKAYPFNFIESVINNPFTLFQAFREILVQKKVLVVSPFSESILLNFSKRRSFFRNEYVYPEFDLRLIETPITYSGLPAELYPHSNWFETVDALKSSLESVDFDIALLSCGSYAMPLGEFIFTHLRRKAIYVGGVLQLFFGIIGRRYEDPFFTDQINRDVFITAVEKEKYSRMIPTSEAAAREAFGAYF